MRKGLLRFALVGSLSLGVPAGVYSGSITGAVRFSDDPLRLPAVKVNKDQDYCGEILPNQTYVIESNGGLKNVVVFIEGYLGDKTVFNLSLPFKGTSIDATSRIRQPGILKVVCDTHAWMLGFVHVFNHPYFAVTDDQGTFSIADLPAGTYVLKAWRKDGGVKSQEITVPDVGEVRDGGQDGGQA
ncbi:MAG: hypothetical protein HYY82_17700 [Deltaproteobacteria bacterium]|nr:hypothetical protein [Deltaproteobacteria bacterium]